ncbi:MAG TPA: hypothetical protein VMM58_13575 [Bacteroidota bacterium]|nr:hypothetical protein [Bacteroidota bacterium]
MNLAELLSTQSSEILSDAETGISRAHLTHYEKSGEENTRQRLKALYGLAVRAVKEKNLGPMVAHAETVARERFEAGFDLSEVQTAFNVLEEAIWKRILKNLPAEQFAEALGLVSTVLGAGKDMLARTYVSLASKSKVPSLDLHSLFSGTGGT